MDTKILIVEDNFIASDEIKDRLHKLGYTNIETAFTGEEALEKATLFEPDLVLMDINLGEGIDGIEAASRLRDQWHIPVIYLTAYDDDKTLQRAKITEPYAYIIKPFEERELSIAIDIALYKHRSEQELQAARDAANAANEAKTQFLTSMSHELRTPLNAILGYAQLCANDERLSAKHRENAGVIYRSGEHLLTMINEVLDLAKIEARRIELEPVTIHLPGILNELADMVRIRAYRKQITFHTDFPADLPRLIVADEKRLRQILLNLLGNAMKFTEEGDVSFRVCSMPSLLEEESGNTSQALVRLHFEVQDTGPGILPDQIEAIFEPFQRVGDQQQRVEGTGLGLAISRELAQMMGGELWVKSTPGQGSTFCFGLDVHEISEDDQAATQSLRKIIGFHGEPRTLLVADDDVANRDILRKLLTGIGFTVHEAVNGCELVEQAATLRPDIILTDLLMPELDGFEATRRIRTAEDSTSSTDRPVIIGVSASVFDQTRQRCLDAGCHDFLLKPVHLQDLLRVIEKHLPIAWRYEDESPPPAPEPPRPVVLPPKHEVVELLDAADSGDIIKIRQWVAQMEQTNPDYRSFLEPIRRLAKEFQLSEIQRYLREHVS